MQLQFTQLQREGDLRFDLVRARENSGALALFDSETRVHFKRRGTCLIISGACLMQLQFMRLQKGDDMF